MSNEAAPPHRLFRPFLRQVQPRRTAGAVVRRGALGSGQCVRMDERAFTKLLDYLGRVPAVEPAMGHGDDGAGRWWVKFSIDIDHPLAWNVVQELGHVLNYLSLGERLPVTFMPVSPPPYLNGGPREYLSWIIEATASDFRPGTCADWLEGRLPRPVDDLSQWAGE